MVLSKTLPRLNKSTTQTKSNLPLTSFLSLSLTYLDAAVQEPNLKSTGSTTKFLTTKTILR